jgi:serine/threonine protein kinase/tetratricopeptide (TPR) repeat protein
VDTSKSRTKSLSEGQSLQESASESQETRRFDSDQIRSNAPRAGMVLRQRYRLDSEIGRGAMGRVFRATDLELLRTVAVKILAQRIGGRSTEEGARGTVEKGKRVTGKGEGETGEQGNRGRGKGQTAEDSGIPGDVAEPGGSYEESSLGDMRSRFMREARAAAALNHPHIVAIYDVGEDHGFPFFVMELVDGPHLGQIPPHDLQQVVDFACQICSALEHAHANNIVHRDLKPANVLLSGVTLKLADLGLALPARGSRISQAGTIVGTAAYMAPEQALGKTLDGRADLYSLGVVLYELTTGRVPFSGDDPLATISQHLHAPVVPPRVLRPDLPRPIETVILRLLAKDPAQRFATAAETATALRNALTESGEGFEEEAGSAVALLDALARGRLVARSTELGEARELWRRAQEGRGHCLLLSGEPGSGKTRLAREVIVQATLDGAVVLSGACYEYEAATPYLPFVEAVRRWVREQGYRRFWEGSFQRLDVLLEELKTGEKEVTKLREVMGDAAPQIAKLAPEVETLLGPFPPRHELPAHEERLLFFDAVTNLFASLAKRQSLLFYLDDLHWADSGTLWLLGHLIRNLREERVLIVASYRDTELDRAHPLAKALVDWNRERFTTRIVLKRFNAEETRAQIAALLDENISGEFSEVVYRETEGNPFFVEEVMKALIEQGSVRRESGRWKRCELVDLVIPQSVKEAIGNRLDRVSAECNETLRAAAVLGKTFTIDELMAAADGLNENKLLDALDEAVAAQLLAADGSEAFVFTHDKIREVLYEELNPIRRRRLHLRTAEGLEQHRLKAPVAVETLAHHFIYAGEYERGLTYAKQAAAEAERIFAYDEAMAAYGSALECAEALGASDETFALEEAMGKTAQLAGDSLRATQHFERALVLARDPLDRARLQCQAATSLVTVGDQRGLAYVREALTVLDPKNNPLETARALAIEGRFNHLAGHQEDAIELLKKAAQLVTAVPESETLTAFAVTTVSDIYAFLAGAYQHLGRFMDGNVWSWRAVEFGNKHNVPLAQAMGYEFLGENTVNLGDWQKALEYAAREREIAERLHSRERRAWTYIVTSISYMISGNAELAERELRAGMTLAESIGEQRLALLLKGNLAIVLADSGRIDEAFRAARENYAASEAIGLLYSRAEGRRCLAHVYFRHGELAETLRLCEEILEMLGEEKSRISRLWLGPLHIEALSQSGRSEEARQRLEEYEALVSDCQTPRCEREVERLKKLLNG